MASNLNAADVLMYDWSDRARKLLEQYKEQHTPDMTPRGEIVPLPPDPDEVVADFFFGKGTGSTPKDILLGFTGPLAGPLTEAAGGESGVLDWLPGGGLVKAGILGGLTGEARKAAMKELLERAAASRKKVGNKRASQNAASSRYYYKQKEKAAEEAMTAEREHNKAILAELEAKKAEEKAASAAQKASVSRMIVNTPGGEWDAAKHHLGENGLYTGQTYRQILGDAADTPENRRAVYVLDSLGSVAARNILPKGVDNPNLGWNARRHTKTTYDDARRGFMDDIVQNRKSGNLPDAPGVKYAPEYLNGKYVDMPFVDAGNGPVSIYDLLFRPKANKKFKEILK